MLSYSARTAAASIPDLLLRPEVAEEGVEVALPGALLHLGERGLQLLRVPADEDELVPCFASTTAASRPMPLVAPVMRMVFIGAPPA